MKKWLCLLLSGMLLIGMSGCEPIDEMIVTNPNEENTDAVVAYKPVIYLYPEEETQVSVRLKLDGELLITEPLYGEGWAVTAHPDGTLTDENGCYPYLFWEARLNADYDMSKGFCVSAADTERFLQEKLVLLGLNQAESADFVEYWLPHLSKNAYNYITFQTEAYTDCAELQVSPSPDCLIRVFMVYQPLDAPVETEEPILIPAERSGFAVVEWGGSKVGGFYA